MNCPQCGFVSFDYLDECKRCGRNLAEHKARLGIRSIRRKEAEELNGEAWESSGEELPDAGQDFEVLEEEETQINLAFCESSGSEAEEEVTEEGEDALDARDVRKGSLLRRALAFASDSVIQIGIIYLFLYAGWYALQKGSNATSSAPPVLRMAENSQAPMIFLACIISSAYFTFFHWATGQTPGKMALGLKVIGRDGRPVSMGLAFLRWFGYIISAIPLMLGFMMALTDRHSQSLHDKMSGTYVVDTEALHAAEAEKVEEAEYYGGDGDQVAEGGALPPDAAT